MKIVESVIYDFIEKDTATHTSIIFINENIPSSFEGEEIFYIVNIELKNELSNCFNCNEKSQKINEIRDSEKTILATYGL